MDLKKFLPGNLEKEEVEYFWALIVEAGWVQAGVWRIYDNKAQVLYTSPPTAWELEENLISATDTALSAAIQNFPEEISDPSKTVFGVMSSWVEGGEIKSEYLALVKKICSELSLKPVGFVVIPEAIAHLAKSEEGAPTNAILIGVYKETLEMAIFKLGNLLGITSVSRSLSIVDDVVEGLARFSETKDLPSRFMIYDGKEGDLENSRQELMKYDWTSQNKLQFLHTPKIEIIDADRKVYAVSLAGASEIANVKTLEVAETANPEALTDDEEVYAQAPSEEQKFEEEEDKIEEEEATPEDFGFTSNIAEASEPIAFAEEAGLTENTNSNISQASNPVAQNKRKISLPKFNFKMPNFHLPKMGFANDAKKPFFVGIGFLLLLLVGGFFWWWYYPKAQATIYISPKKLDERIELTISPEITEANIDQRQIPAQTLSSSVSSEKTKSTTGTKMVGDKAKGEVTFYRVGTQMMLPKGTTIQGPESLKFVTDEEVSIASGSASTPGTAKAKVTASEIGVQYNLASGTSFRVGTYSSSDIEAKNETVFSGGSSREINAVSADDQKALLADLTEELTEKAKNEIKDGLSGDLYMVEESLDATPSEQQFSNKVGDEADTVKLSLAVEGKALAVKKDELGKLLLEILKDKVPEGYVLRSEQIETQFSVKKDEKYKFEAKVEANLLPKIDTDEIGKKIAGKFKKSAEEYLKKEVPGFVRAEIKVRPKLPGRLGSIPRVAKNISVTLSAEK